MLQRRAMGTVVMQCYFLNRFASIQNDVEDMTNYALLCSLCRRSPAYRFVIRPDAVFGASSDSMAGNLVYRPVIAPLYTFKIR